eukprot:gene7444-8266_t
MASSTTPKIGLGGSAVDSDDDNKPEEGAMLASSAIPPANIEDKESNTENLPDNYKAAVELLASGIKSNYLADVNKAKGRVDELVHNQSVLRESIQQEMMNLDEYKLTEDVSQFMQDLRFYHSKLLNIKKDIHQVSDKVSKMKKKSMKLQIGKQKEELHKAQQKQKELELQKQLTAKPASSSFSN